MCSFYMPLKPCQYLLISALLRAWPHPGSLHLRLGKVLLSFSILAKDVNTHA